MALNTLVQKGVPVDLTKRGAGGSGLGLAPFDTYRLRGDIKRRNSSNSNSNSSSSSSSKDVIGEFMFDAEMGHWRYSRLRPDKEYPNYMPVVMNVLMEQAEDVSIEVYNHCRN